MKKLQLGPKLVAESRKAMDRLSRDMVDLAAKRDSVDASSMTSNVKNQYAAVLNKGHRSGLYRSVVELEHTQTCANYR
jgi:hypothetical protein